MSLSLASMVVYRASVEGSFQERKMTCHPVSAMPVPLHQSHHARHIHTWSVVQNDKHEDEGFSTVLFEPQSCKHRQQVATVIIIVIIVRRVVSRDRFDLMVGDI